jgi:hypothetical protein
MPTARAQAEDQADLGEQVDEALLPLGRPAIVACAGERHRTEGEGIVGHRPAYA